MNYSGKRLVVLGAGYIGAEVARQGMARGLHVTALTRNRDQANALAAIGVDPVVADLADANWHRRIPDGVDFVLNSVSAGGGRIEGYRHSHIQGMRSILAWSAQTKLAGTIVYTSSTSVYAQGGGTQVDETAPAGGGSATADALVETENLLRAASGTAAGQRAFILRLAGIYGPGRHHLLDQMQQGLAELPGHGHHRLNLIHRDDICAAIWAAFATTPKGMGGVFNVADDGAATKAEVIAWLAARLGTPLPCFTGKAATDSRRAVTPDRVIVNDLIKRTLGWQPVYPTFREGYAAILAECK